MSQTIKYHFTKSDLFAVLEEKKVKFCITRCFQVNEQDVSSVSVYIKLKVVKWAGCNKCALVYIRAENS